MKARHIIQFADKSGVVSVTAVNRFAPPFPLFPSLPPPRGTGCPRVICGSAQEQSGAARVRAVEARWWGARRQ